MKLKEIVEDIKNRYKIIGREKELLMMVLAHKANKNILLEGEIGVGKTTLARAIAEYFDQGFHRVEGTEDLNFMSLIGTWQPPFLIQKGYCEEAFEYGPLARAMLDGGCLFINEINRAPESTQNMLLTALDEKILDIPNLKTIKARDGFFMIATRNPASHVGVSVLGEALMDRFVCIKLDYQSADEEKEIVKLHTGCSDEKLIDAAVKINRATRKVRGVIRGASVRGAIDIVSMLMNVDAEDTWRNLELWIEICTSALITKMEFEEGINKAPEEIIRGIVEHILKEDFFL
ncbi:MAG: AAA family ATPase [Promethearchaeota archaeon]